MEARFLYDQPLVRLHVVAESDEMEAQRVKLCVVRAVRKTAARVAKRAKSAPDAFTRLTCARRGLERVARRAARREGFMGDVRVKTGVFPFPQKQYADMLVPAGAYRAVRVELGSAAGQNWWCVLYPDLCAVEEVCAKALTGPEAVQFYSSIAQFVGNLLKGVGI